MSRKCFVKGTKVLFGNNVSHSNRKTRRTFMPNIQVVSIWSEILKKKVTMKLTPRGLKTLEHNGGLDSYITATPSTRLTDEAKKLKKEMKKAAEKLAA